MRLSLYDNAIDFIQKGIEEYKDGVDNDDERCFKYAIINLAQGVELILKQILKSEHEMFIFSDIDGGKKGYTIEADKAINRINRVYQLKGKTINQKQKKILDSIRQKRNDIIHYEFDLNAHHAQATIAKVFPVIDEILKLFLDTNLREDLPEEVWEQFIEIERIHNEYYKSLKDKYSFIGFGKHRLACEICSMKTIVKHNRVFQCAYCNHTYDSIEELIIALEPNDEKIEIIEAFISTNHLPAVNCPKCDYLSLIYDREDGGFLCLWCSENIYDVDSCDCPHCSGDETGFIFTEVDGDGIFTESAICLNCGDQIRPESCDSCGNLQFNLTRIEYDDYNEIGDNGSPERKAHDLCSSCYYRYYKEMYGD